MADLFKTNRIPVIGPDYDSQNYGVKNVDATIQQITVNGTKQVIKGEHKIASFSADNFYNEVPTNTNTKIIDSRSNTLR